MRVLVLRSAIPRAPNARAKAGACAHSVVVWAREGGVAEWCKSASKVITMPKNFKRTFKKHLIFKLLFHKVKIYCSRRSSPRQSCTPTETSRRAFYPELTKNSDQHVLSFVFDFCVWFPSQTCTRGMRLERYLSLTAPIRIETQRGLMLTKSQKSSAHSVNRV